MILSVHVVIPARDEQELLSRCLLAVRQAIAHATAVRPGLICRATVVLDSCLDDSALVVAQGGARALVVQHGLVGAARDSGARVALAEDAAAGVPASRTWLASTDADTVVPPHWISGQLALAENYDAVIGTVQPLGLTDPQLLAQWHLRHQLREGHPHVHGANLGVRGSTYLQIGGFRPVSSDEDVDLVRRIRARTDRWVATDTVRADTSARMQGRLRGGFSDYLTTLRGTVTEEAG
ncbi:glycosyltransferase [Serinicoccus sp. LYQ131]|uniref:glycosyltransferase n=1 Tax=Serinicoccus sp. LYQ131 TaxID=3378797 RepID=UPI003854E733